MTVEFWVRCTPRTVQARADRNTGNKIQRTRTQNFISAGWMKQLLSKAELRRHIVEQLNYYMASSAFGCSLHNRDNLSELLVAATDVYHG